MTDWPAFELWLSGRYASSTVRMTLGDARQLVACAEKWQDPPTRLYAAARRLQAWIHDGGAVPDEVWAVLEHATSSEARYEAFSRERKKPARAFDPAAWERLAHAILADPSVEARVCELILVTGLRIGDVLRLSKRQLERAVTEGAMVLITKGGHERELYIRGRTLVAVEHLLAGWAGSATVGARLYQGRSARGAYDLVRRRLQMLAAELGIDGVVHLHRMRRTIAMQALAVTKDVGAVQQLLGHKSITTTMRYLDEERPEDVAQLQDKLHAFLPNDDEEK